MSEFAKIVGLLEPGVAEVFEFGSGSLGFESHNMVAGLSIAISLKRIADALQPPAAAEWIEVGTLDPMQRPVGLESSDLVLIRTAIGESPIPVLVEHINWHSPGPGQPTHYIKVPRTD